MGIAFDTLYRLMELRLGGLLPRRTAVMEIGAQQLTNSFIEATDQLQKLGAFFGIAQPIDLGAPTPVSIAHGEMKHLDIAAPAARKFWLWLGFEHAAIDIDGSPGSIALDLNFDSVPPPARGRYHLVTNFGTTEHVTNQLNAFEVIHDLTAREGLMLHHVPAQGFANHGFFNYNAKFFWMLARSNGYRWIYGDYSQGEPYPLPSNILESLSQRPPYASYNVADGGLCIIMQKVFDIPFVPPLDVATGTQTNVAAVKRRYWSVFEADAFERFEAGRAKNGSGLASS